MRLIAPIAAIRRRPSVDAAHQIAEPVQEVGA
ncbi:hypothetical protein SAMN05878426_102583 [Phaeovulum vinaykumarii]|nr:hypothetical protein SAMN05878426_102583 [Phaeovulum vinaykumarii]